MIENDKFILTCVNLGLELTHKDEKTLSKTEKQFLKELEKLSIIKTDSIYNITFKKPYRFEGQTYDGIDISAIENLSLKQLDETSDCYGMEFTYRVASKLTNKPISFFMKLPVREVYKIETAVKHRVMKEQIGLNISIQW
ncbi:hypothetical protein [Clostridium sp.]|uniref:hypothetical protein n=1 Tax=Clostridium sp. TaxID=1506 RepID=UPI00262F7A17|nr:hypothetical protein [Clostridium sp.]